MVIIWLHGPHINCYTMSQDYTSLRITQFGVSKGELCLVNCILFIWSIFPGPDLLIQIQALIEVSYGHFLGKCPT